MKTGLDVALETLGDELRKGIMQQREAILRAFVAETGCNPSEAIQVEQRMPDMTSRWYVRKKDETDLAMEAQARRQRVQSIDNPSPLN